jgi:hypothetical protein
MLTPIALGRGTIVQMSDIQLMNCSFSYPFYINANCIELTEEEVEYIDKPYQPQPILTGL